MKTTTARDTAELFTLLGYPIVLIQPHPAKLPIHKGWPTRKYTDDEVQQLFTQYPDMGVGIKLGGPTGLVDIEGDGPSASVDWDILTAGLDIPSTMSWASGRGQHRLFKLPRDYRDSIGEGIIKIGDLEIRLGSTSRYTHYSILPPVGGRVWIS